MDKPLASWTPPPRPEPIVIVGRYVRLEPLTGDHLGGLWEAQLEDETGAMWTYLPVGPFAARADYAAWISAEAGRSDPVQFAIRMEDGRLGGTLALMRIAPEAGSIEAGWLTFSPRLQRTREATEAVTLLVRWAFDAGYRRFEWKCNALNRASRRAAQRFGFSYEGIFRQAAVVKGHNRDTAWFAAIDGEWPMLRSAYETWLDPVNFDEAGRQRTSLASLTSGILAKRDPIFEG